MLEHRHLNLAIFGSNPALENWSLFFHWAVYKSCLQEGQALLWRCDVTDHMVYRPLHPHAAFLDYLGWRMNFKLGFIVRLFLWRFCLFVAGEFSCESNPCKNNGLCSVGADTIYTCTCVGDFSGRNCDVRKYKKNNIKVLYTNKVLKALSM